MLERPTPRLAARTLLAVALAAGWYPAATVAGAPPPATGPRGTTPTLTATIVKSGLVNPWDIAFTNDGRMFVTERPGRIRLYSSGNPGSTLQMTFTVPKVWQVAESGLLGIALDRGFDDNRLLYICRSRMRGSDKINQVMAYRFTGSTLAFSHWVIQDGMNAAEIHNGSAVEHGPDGKLWVTMGDANDRPDAQDPDTLNGKILRVETSGAIPADNPLMPGAAAVSAVYSMGHRNPQGIAFQPVTHEPYTLEHGPDRDDEANWIRPGLNYGWPCYTGNNDPLFTSGCGPVTDYTPSVWASGTPTLATSGASFTNHPSWGDWNRDLFVSTLKEADVRRLDPVTATSFTLQDTLFDEDYGRLRASAKGRGGRLYLTSSNGSNDKVIRVVASTP